MLPPLFSRDLEQRIDLRLAVSDDVVGDYPRHIRCREHNDKQRGNLAVYRDHLHCFVCGWHESRTLAGLAYLLKLELTEAAKVAERYTAASLDGYRERTALESRRDPLPGSLASIYHGVLYQQRRARVRWLHARGLSDVTLAHFQVGHNGTHFVIPVHDREGRLIALRLRRDDLYNDEKTAKYLGLKGRNGCYFFDERELVRSAPATVVVCEGEFDTMRLWQEGIPAVTVTNGAGQLPNLPRMLRESFPFIRRLIVAADMDEPGREAAQLTELAAIAQGFEAVATLTWSEGKDVSEAFQLGSLTKKDFELW